MRIEIDSVVICDNDPVSDLRINGTRIVDIVDKPGAEEIQPIDRKNRRTALSFLVTRSHDGTDEAADFIMLHFAELEGNGMLSLTVFADSGAERTRVLNPAVIEVVDADQMGVTSRIRYQIVGGMFKQTP